MRRNGTGAEHRNRDPYQLDPREIATLFDLPFIELVYQAATVHRANHPANEVQLSTLLSIKTGGCPEDCGYCHQSISAETGLKAPS